ncbi:hypothetical protein [Caldimonas brevitalea]|uniref:Uncharacterized protein n=1 Tax=Caldimonas brevitalea TaxID=413882 RepID=A0A0G3BNF5_9BURK|nr:hypothetical protein [Caldimonas brevitalea]AKJ30932.1 hypothetical protein AAW51_4241 [Caldimonas brevitalea]
MTDRPLTETQRQVLEHAIDHTEGRIEWFPPQVKGAARSRVLRSLFNRALVITDGANWRVAVQAYDLLGRERPKHHRVDPFEELDRLLAVAQALWELEQHKPKLHEPLRPYGGDAARRRAAPLVAASSVAPGWASRAT